MDMCGLNHWRENSPTFLYLLKTLSPVFSKLCVWVCVCVCVCVFFRGASGGRPVSAKRQKGHHGNAWLVASEILRLARKGNSAVLAHIHMHTHSPYQTTEQSATSWNIVFNISSLTVIMPLIPKYTDVNVHLICFSGFDSILKINFFLPK